MQSNHDAAPTAGQEMGPAGKAVLTMATMVGFGLAMVVAYFLIPNVSTFTFFGPPSPADPKAVAILEWGTIGAGIAGECLLALRLRYLVNAIGR